VNIATALRKLDEWTPSGERIDGADVLRLAAVPDVRLARTNLLHLHAESFEAAARAAQVPFEAIVFLSKHRAASARPALTVHPVGNFAAAEFGGQPGRLSPSAPALQSELLRALAARARRHAYAGEVTFEVTHHGPLLSTPSCFLELGSSEQEWNDPGGARLVAAALLDVVQRPLPSYPIAVGLGGGHYGPRFTEAVLTRQVHFGHMIPTYAAERIERPQAALEEVLGATPGAAGVYPHRKMLERATFDRWAQALSARGMRWLESDAWPPPAPAGPDAVTAGPGSSA
jgi:D-aminoacyl-tRNA deacylase